MEFGREKKINDNSNPIDLIEDTIYRYDIDFFRDTPNDLSIRFKGLWDSYDVNFSWNEFSEIIEISCNLRISKEKKVKSNILSLLSMVNKEVSLGFFDFCKKSESIFFNYKISVKGIKILSKEQIEDFIDVVTTECDRFFPVFYVFFKKKQDPNYALKAALFDTCGEA